ncbi:hypothetical protein AZO1586R_2104 [Bathymodiolus azoricus thioautotrophic gill symbiont]|uniref:Uncharacterized protein n=1 Tax=Bathymodiolus azoricus thioautotrophic gill symbiont TaxID=235205 RepID=A0ACA8ZTM4_9GAMM|nr:hypothetical protein AZO1586R_2104 [Bathymodiolus azoricus thioautotrophic gill symbiont]VVH59786.1 hypothetical protein BAZOLSSOX_948 [uncultured Gammaproteobacteria bacterium]
MTCYKPIIRTILAWVLWNSLIKKTCTVIKFLLQFCTVTQ